MDLLKLILTYMVVLTGTAVQAVDATPLPYERCIHLLPRRM